LNGQIEQHIKVQRLTFYTGPESMPLEQLHNDERLVSVFVNVMDGADVGMIERGGGFGLTPEAFQCEVILREALRQELESHEAMQVCVLGPVDHSHTTAAELFQDTVMGDGAADHVHRGQPVAGILLYARR